VTLPEENMTMTAQETDGEIAAAEDTALDKVYEDTDDYGRILVVEDEQWFIPLYRGKEQQYVELSLKAEPEEPYILRIPSMYQEKTVIAFADITDSEYVKEIVVSDGVACPPISGCTVLEKLEVGNIDPDALTEIYDELGRESENDYSFIIDAEMCPLLTTVDFHEHADYDWIYFLGCPVQEMEVPNSVKWLASVYNGDTEMDGYEESTLKSAVVPEKVTRIVNCFQSCPNLTEVTIACTSVEIEGSFENCAALKKLQLPSGVKSLASCFRNDAALQWVELSEGTVSVTASFSSCPELQWVFVPASVTEMNEQCFQDCPKVTLVVQPDSFGEQYAEEQGLPYVYEADFDRSQLEEGALE
jgi:hypothetical protein